MCRWGQLRRNGIPPNHPPNTLFQPSTLSFTRRPTHHINKYIKLLAHLSVRPVALPQLPAELAPDDDRPERTVGDSRRSADCVARVTLLHICFAVVIPVRLHSGERSVDPAEHLPQVV
ncbi:hypothetical protein BLNAU_19297 [Blattamonas nauphoetae]|uniref:Uncharacterized protein n=1 Tax=Blattamonas nauphoetae TaxID=2049346 RepID=A0ABQ9X209_9EUKA|nr:hypothetical protein BLNAU_19297 [Blattamonas nauphoetae]